MSETNQNYHAIIPLFILHSKVLPPTAKILYCEITSLLNREGYCTTSNHILGLNLNISESMVSRYISLLKDLNYIDDVAFDGRTRIIKISSKAGE